MVTNRHRGFLSASSMLLLVIALSVSLSLAGGLQLAVASARRNRERVNAQLAFEENLIRLDQGKSFRPFQTSSHRLTAQLELRDGIKTVHLCWLEDGCLKEEQWLENAASSFGN